MTSQEEEDHLESATRGISELSRLLGTDSGGGDSHAPLVGSTKGLHQMWGGANSAPTVAAAAAAAVDGLTTGVRHSVPASALALPGTRPLGIATGLSDSALSPQLGGKAYLSTLLESHGTLHHTKSPSPSPALAGAAAAGLANSQSPLPLSSPGKHPLPSHHLHIEPEQTSR